MYFLSSRICPYYSCRVGIHAMSGERAQEVHHINGSFHNFLSWISISFLDRNYGWLLVNYSVASADVERQLVRQSVHMAHMGERALKFRHVFMNACFHFTQRPNCPEPVDSSSSKVISTAVSTYCCSTHEGRLFFSLQIWFCIWGFDT